MSVDQRAAPQTPPPHDVSHAIGLINTAGKLWELGRFLAECGTRAERVTVLAFPPPAEDLAAVGLDITHDLGPIWGKLAVQPLEEGPRMFARVLLMRGARADLAFISDYWNAKHVLALRAIDASRSVVIDDGVGNGINRSKLVGAFHQPNYPVQPFDAPRPNFGGRARQRLRSLVRISSILPNNLTYYSRWAMPLRPGDTQIERRINHDSRSVGDWVLFVGAPLAEDPHFVLDQREVTLDALRSALPDTPIKYLRHPRETGATIDWIRSSGLDIRPFRPEGSAWHWYLSLETLPAWVVFFSSTLALDMLRQRAEGQTFLLLDIASVTLRGLEAPTWESNYRQVLLGEDFFGSAQWVPCC